MILANMMRSTDYMAELSQFWKQRKNDDQSGVDLANETFSTIILTAIESVILALPRRRHKTKFKKKNGLTKSVLQLMREFE